MIVLSYPEKAEILKSGDNKGDNKSAETSGRKTKAPAPDFGATASDFGGGFVGCGNVAENDGDNAAAMGERSDFESNLIWLHATAE